MSYQDALDNESGIQSDVNSGKMPPYPPDRNYQHYQNERYLSDSEKLAINQWVKKGGPSGNLRKAPAPPVYDYTKDEITDPDFAAGIPVYTVPDTITSDVYRCFVISNPFPQPKYVSELEVIPGNRGAVHHVFIYQDTSGIPVKLDEEDILPGYSMFGGIGSESAELISGWTPAQGTFHFPSDMGLKIDANSRIILQIHYPTASAGKIDSTRINIKYNTNSHVRKVMGKHLLNIGDLVNGPLRIPPNKVKTFYEKSKLSDSENISLLGIMPHAHLLCKMMEAYAVKPDGDTVQLIKIDHWDFHWQGTYMFKKMITIPGGSTLYGKAVYDNTINNPNNPNSPPKLVTNGEETTDEMMRFYFYILKSEPGDKEIVFDTTTRLPTYNNCGFVVRRKATSIIESSSENESLNEKSIGNPVSIYPNPVHDKLQISLKTAETAKVLVYNINGQLVYERSAKQGNNQFDLQHLPNGYYVIRVINAKINTTLRFVKQ